MSTGALILAGRGAHSIGWRSRTRKRQRSGV